MLPAFDTTLGTLLSAQLVMSGGMLTTLFTHTGAPIGSVVTRASATGEATLFSFDQLFSTLSVNTSHATIMAGEVAFISPYAEVSSTAFDSTNFNQTYTGASLSKFIGSPLGFFAGRPHP